MRNLASQVGNVALSPNGSAVYYQGDTARPPFPIYGLSTAGGGQPIEIGSGSAPAVSPDNSEVGYAAADGRSIDIYDVSRKTTRRIELSSLIGNDADLGNTGSILAWVSKSLLVAVPLQDASFASAGPAPSLPGQPATCSAAYALKKQCAIVINLGAAQTARLVIVSAAHFLGGVAGPGNMPGTLLVGGPDGTISRYEVSPTALAAEGTVTVLGKGVIVEAFSPDGREVLYLQPGGPTSPPLTVGPGPTSTKTSPETGVELRAGNISQRFTQTRLLLADAYVSNISW
ncbi:MAG: hypothetical protein M3Y91_14460 [Actinomycetota bacterium]|nr:hypothetical protein [Actinomycetota bacterium]